MVVVKKKKGESEDSLINRFRFKVKDERILDEHKEKQSYQKPSEKRNKRNKRVKYQIELEKKRNIV